ncbi:PREDICTED: cytochrome P450 4C1-like [Papilio polytes]|uniref:cytochrome P450 4C1-like n=1 Tax=Papilio polytes TaxID=76194 RepID=UPI000676941B|nr:PREDICTED: cytochrome P450 4C1-like [Papilio polytes]
MLLWKIPGFKNTFLIGNLLEILLPPVQLFSSIRQIAKEKNGIYRFWCFPIASVNIYNPEDVEVILSSMKYHEKSQAYTFLKPWLQDGLLLSSGTKWQNRRKILTPAFHFSILRRYYASIVENTNRLVESLGKIVDTRVDIVPIMSDCTLNSICESIMGTKLNDNKIGKTYKNSIHELGAILVKRFITICFYIDFIFNLSELGKRQKKYLGINHNFTRTIINDRKKHVKENGVNFFEETEGRDDEYRMMYSKKKRTTMLDLLILAEQEGLIDTVGIEEEVDTFMFEGHDTTATGLSYCLMLLANHPEIQFRLLRLYYPWILLFFKDEVILEQKEIFGDTKRTATVDDLHKMTYLDRCIKESLRLYPPVPFISRWLNESVTLSNYTVPAGTSCHIHIYDLHRNERLYPNPSVFDPDRFLPENVAKRHHYAYVPFSAGPRNCIGQKFAIMVMKSIVSGIMRNFRLHPVTTCSDLRFQADLVLRNSEPVYIKFTKREIAI